MKHLASHFHHLARMKGREGLMMLLEGEGRLLFEEGGGAYPSLLSTSIREVSTPKMTTSQESTPPAVLFVDP